MSEYYDRQGNPMTLMEWAALYENADIKSVKRDVLEDGKVVSTIWKGLDHRFGEGAPLIFETMVFPSEEDFGELDGERYSTEDEAIVGHIAMVGKWTEHVAIGTYPPTL